VPLRRSRSFKVTEFGTNRKPIYDFLLPLIELFSLGVTAEDYERLLVENRRFRSNGGRL